ncbi:DEAD/DEAH box helicase [Flavobacterium psychrophilum]|uniref:DEAD/DEAH box helicase n=1 Tax=Flavobacterium psychrophilum TaxID=96345 RepID=UPI00073F3041|nr:DEAD/DEAH box helicase [Flavobacterium psychrophilum]EKT4519769.1 DEAD/DEAH box helicase [Flavobacterium psychrophilum]ELV7524217.1 DEAD/DEAH box helicase [Flavobacterium psychrophilum]QZL00906.1 DEAD/DEAH box helicase [Flavobacterium psychrophilum]SNB05755.1 ATP-dependent RNA helicase DbpA [Flavobacterium psychrophilum]SNB95422.1 ATP-dependent RNA helicase DbpA [Flavobacterium psychrophilum]
MNNNPHSNNILLNLGIESLNEMQEVAQDAILNDNNVLLLSPTGSGKTLAFLLPIFEMLQENITSVQCLILVPSRELALQIEQVWKKMGTSYKVNVCYGGHSIDTEIKNLSNPPAVLIGTPGRIADHIDRRTFSVDAIQTLILDEFDKSLQLGFHEQMSFIINRLPKLNKRVLVSATSDIEIPKYTRVINPTVLDFIPSEEEKTNLLFQLVVSKDKDKIGSLFNLICSLKSESAIIFCNHRDAAERISDTLNEKGIYATYYHGGMDQDERERALIQFRNGSVSYLITTDLAARGLDIPEMKHVIHYHLPSKEDEFTHRNGRTARMLATGTAYLVIHESEKKLEYIDYKMPVLEVENSTSLPKAPEFQTIYISGGKKTKLNKIDIVGFFSQKGKLEKGDLGLIEVKDFISFAAVKSKKVKDLLNNIRDEKMKGKKFKIEVARKVLKKEED